MPVPIPLMKNPRRTCRQAVALVAGLCLVALPASAELRPVASGAYHWADHPLVIKGDRASRQILEGTSPHLSYLKIHATTQAVGAEARPAKANPDAEELIIVKEGLLRMTLDDHSDVLGAGSVVHLFPGQVHRIENVGDVPLTYFVMKYRSRKPVQIERGLAAGGSKMFNVNTLPLKRSARGAGRAYFDRATAMCERFEMHVTQLYRKGPSHNPHEHIETEIILVISGDTEMTIGGEEFRATAGDFYLMTAHVPHGVRNATDQPCAYFAFKWN